MNKIGTQWRKVMCKEWNKRRERLQKTLEVNVANLVNHMGCAAFSVPVLNKTATLTLTQDTVPKNINGTIVEALYEKALLLACERIADSDQTYEEATTANFWAERFLDQASDGIGNEKLAAEFVKRSGKTQHASDCATSCSPAERPSTCDCDE